MKSALRTSLIAPLIGVSLVAFACAPTGQAGSPGGGVGPASTPQPTATPVPASHKDISVEIDGQVVKLVNGAAETEAAPGSASKVVTRYFGNEATGDLNADGNADVAFVITQSRGGSGTFFYVVAALKSTSGYTGTNAVLLGDRIAPQTTQIIGTELIVNYADRKSGEPMTASPSVGTSKYLKVVAGMLQASR